MAEVMPVRQRAGYLSALSKTYSAIRRLIETGGSTDEALELQTKLQERYEKYLKCHEAALVAVPEREESLNASHINVDQRHLEVEEQLQAYINDGNKSEKSLHVGSLFSSRTSVAASSKRSSRKTGRSVVSQAKSNSDKLSEARIQAQLAKSNVEQQRLIQEAQQQKLMAERETARQKREFEIQAAEKKREMERDAARQKMEYEEQLRRRDEEIKQADIDRRLLQEETERQHKELENQLEMQRKIAEMEKLRTEVKVREREEMRSTLGSDYESSDEEREDVTKPKKTVVSLGFQSIDDQQASMFKILGDLSKPKHVEDKTEPQRDVVSWLDQSHVNRKPLVPFNTPAQPREGYVPPLNIRRDVSETQSSHENVMSKNKAPLQQSFPILDESRSMQGKSDAALFSRVLQENRLPKPKMMTFDGDPKRYKLFMASFRNNVEARLDGDDQLKLTLLLDQCTGKAFELIEECVMLKPEQGYRTAIEKLERRFGKNHLIARSYIDGVKKGGAIKLNDVDALVRLADDMRKCQNVLTELRFASDLDSTGTIESIIDRLPECLQNQWVKRSNRILNAGSEPTFQDLTVFVEERADDFNSKYGQYLAEKRAMPSKPRQHDHFKSKEKRRNVTTFATSTTGETSAAGLDAASTCTSTTFHKSEKKCVYCEKPGHYIATCFRFKKLSLQEKRDTVMKNNLCFRCLKAGHGSASCDKVCSKCSKKHHYHLHDEKQESSKQADDKKTTAAGVVASTTFKDRGRASLGVLRVRVKNEGKEVLCWALVDSGSNTTFIKRSAADELGIKGPDHIFSVNTLGGTACHDEMCVDLLLVSEDGAASVDVRGAFTIPSLSIRAKYDGTAHTNFKHLSDLVFPAVDTEIEIVIGTDCTEMFWTLNERHGGLKEPIARLTRLGWILLGPTEQKWNFSANATSVESIETAYNKMLMADFEDVKLKEPVMSVDDKRALKTMEETVCIQGGKFCVGIPWKVNPEEALQNNRSLAESRLRMLKRKFENDPKLKEDYTKTVEAYIADGHAMLVEDGDVNEIHQWFLPHHAVFKRSNPEKCRVVFDCAAQFKGVSLNDVILQGPNFLNNLSGVLTRFRKEPVAVIGDIKLMFHQCFVMERDRRFLRFLWWRAGDTSQKPQVHAMKVHLFGGKSSPSVVNYCMRKITDDNEEKFSELAIDTLRRAFYMDDMITSVGTIEEAKGLVSEMQSLLEVGGFELSKFMSTSREVIDTVQEGKRAKSLQNIDINDSALPQESALGLKWNVEGDFFTYSVDLQEKPLTKRGLLATTASLYDPLGLVAPVLLIPKLIQQELCRLELDWDDQIPDDKSRMFCKWRGETTALSLLRIQRCFQDGSSRASDRELHIFTDASEFAYGAAAYLKVTSETDVHVSLVM